MKLAWVVLIAACGPPPVMLVRDVRIEGHDLVLVRCPVTSGDRNRSWSAWRACATKRVRLPLVVADDERPSVPVPTPDREVIYRRIGHARTALRVCAETLAPRGDLAVELTLDADGQLSAIQPVGLASCIRAALGDTPFAVSQQKTQVSFSIRNPVTSAVEIEATP